MKGKFRLFLVFVALAVVIATVTLALWPKQRITAANYDKIQIGMSQAELRGVLGPPQRVEDFVGQFCGEEFISVENGMLVRTFRVGDQGFITALDYNYSHYGKDELRRMGFKDYQRQVWISSEISIVLITNQEGHVADRFSGEGVTWNWRRFLPFKILVNDCYCINE
jgi:hypothetical protein